MSTKSNKSAKDYFKKKQTSERRLFRLVQRSHDPAEYKKFLEALKEARTTKPVDLTKLTDGLGFTLLSFAIFKEKSMAAKALLEHVKSVETGIFAAPGESSLLQNND